MNHIVNIFREHDNFVLAGHTSPDGDCIGSCFALALALHKMGKAVQVVLEPFTRKYAVIPGQEFLFKGNIEQLTPTVFVALDCGDIDRLNAARVLFDCAEITVCVDHHATNNGFADHNYIVPDASSASEMVFKIIDELIEPTPEIAAAVYAGMVSDTGGFRFNATAISTMKTAARLMEMIPFTQIYNEILHVHSFAAGKALGLAMEKSERTDDKRVVYTYLSREMLRSVGANNSDIEGVVEYLMGTRHALVAILVYEKGSGTKVSLRSQGPNVGRIAAQLGGGGHVLAAGASVLGETIESVLARAVSLAGEEVRNFTGDKLVEAAEVVRPTEPTGVINIRKEKGFTSHDVVAVVRRAAQAKTGHTGTLDPDATGVLPICLGRATKFAEHFSAADKTYIAEIVLGITTDTGDTSGEILTRQDASSIEFAKLKQVAESFIFENRGEYLQVPPMYSAVKIGGKKLYELARKGQTVERKPRPVKILSLEVFAPRADGRIFMEVTCTKGTYIRSLCADIGEALGCGAAMGELERTRSGMFSIENSFSLDEVKDAAESGRLDELILPVTEILPYPAASIVAEALPRALNGNPIPAEMVTGEKEIEIDEKCWLYYESEETERRIIGLFLRTKNKYLAEVMF